MNHIEYQIRYFTFYDKQRPFNIVQDINLSIRRYPRRTFRGIKIEIRKVVQFVDNPCFIIVFVVQFCIKAPFFAFAKLAMVQFFNLFSQIYILRTILKKQRHL
eukprot:NODE_259_length_11524_cov_0.251028.p12 type:complete len:103 gc:universal NODE_259_length_11524_cov_0.251028:9973-10281(+)